VHMSGGHHSAVQAIKALSPVHITGVFDTGEHGGVTVCNGL